MSRGFSTRVELGNIVGGLTMEEWLKVGGRDVVVGGFSVHSVEGEGWVGICIAEGEREGPGAIGGGALMPGFGGETLLPYLKVYARSQAPYCPGRICCKLASCVRVEHDFSRCPICPQ